MKTVRKVETVTHPIGLDIDALRITVDMEDRTRLQVSLAYTDLAPIHTHQLAAVFRELAAELDKH